MSAHRFMARLSKALPCVVNVATCARSVMNEALLAPNPGNGTGLKA